MLLGLDRELRTTVAMAEAPHGTAPALEGKDIANPMAMILAVAALLHYAGADRASRAAYEAVLETTAAGTRTPDLGGHAYHDRVRRRRDRAGRPQARGLGLAGRPLASAARPCPGSAPGRTARPR